MKPVSVEEAIAEIEEVLEENEISPDENVVRAAPTGPLIPLLPTPTSETPEVERLYQNAVERHIHAHGEPPNPFQALVLRRHAEMETGLTSIQSPAGTVTSPDTPTELSLEEFIQNRPPTELCPVEREQLDHYGELFDVSREERETDESYRERIRQRAYPHLT